MIRTRAAPKVATDLKPEAPIDPLTGRPLAPRGAKFGNQPCEDQEGNKFASLAERRTHLAFMDAFTRGVCSKPTRQAYNLVVNDVKVSRYTSDVEITARADFFIDTPAERYQFKAGQSYTIDVKSGATKTNATDMRFKLMKALYGIDVMTVYSKKPRPTARKRKKQP